MAEGGSCTYSAQIFRMSLRVIRTSALWNSPGITLTLTRTHVSTLIKRRWKGGKAAFTGNDDVFCGTESLLGCVAALRRGVSHIPWKFWKFGGGPLYLVIRRLHGATLALLRSCAAAFSLPQRCDGTMSWLR
ncbi:hypothetical protein MHYP_G00316820 [Metynnis hypsauchen]